MRKRMVCGALAVLASTVLGVAAEDAARKEGSAPVEAAGHTAVKVHDAAPVVATYSLPFSRPAGLAWQEPYLWVLSDDTDLIYKLAPPSLDVVAMVPVPVSGWCFGLENDGTDLWSDSDEPDQIYRLAEDTGWVLDTFPSPFAAPNGLAWDGTGMWHSGYGADLALIDPGTGGVLRWIPSPGSHSPRGMEWDGTALWVVDANLYPDDAIYRLDPADGTVLASYQPDGVSVQLMLGIAFDGTFLWLSDLDAQQIHKLVISEGSIFVSGFDTGDTTGWSAVVP